MSKIKSKKQFKEQARLSAHLNDEHEAQAKSRISYERGLASPRAAKIISREVREVREVGGGASGALHESCERGNR